MATAVVIAAIVATLVVIAVVLEQGSVGCLSEEAGRPPARDAGAERPAGPDAEPMHPDPPGRFPDDTRAARRGRRTVSATAPLDTASGAGAAAASTRVDVVIPTVGRPSLTGLVWVVCHALPASGRVLLVDDRADPTPPLEPGVEDRRISVVTSGGRGPAAARNAGWRASTAPWIAFVDDDVDPPLGWVRALCEDVRRAAPDVGAVQGRIEVPLPADRRPTDWERNVAGLDGATWITADMVVRRAALEVVGGFDDRFSRAYREDTDLAVRLLDAGWRLTVGERRVRHPVRPAGWWTSVRLQRGNADDVLLERLHGRGWRPRVGAPPGGFRTYPLTTGLVLAAAAGLATGHRRIAGLAGVGWMWRTGRFAWRRTAAGPRTPAEVATMIVTSVAIPPAACWHRLRGHARWRAVRRALVRPVPGGGPSSADAPTDASPTRAAS